MSEPRKPSQVKLFIGVIFSGEGVLIKAKETLEKKFGPIDFQSNIVPFGFTGYYEKEMGTNLKRQFFSFKRLMNPNSLPIIKIYTNNLEKKLNCAAKNSSMRAINLDPGYICAAKLILATCKDYSHRIYLDKGVYAEITLNFQGKSFVSWPWTYPDYQTKEYIQIFNEIREIYMKQLPR